MPPPHTRAGRAYAPAQWRRGAPSAPPDLRPVPTARSARLAAALAAALAGCLAEPDPLPRPNSTALRAEWTAWVAARDSVFRSPASPLRPEDRIGWGGLAYFPYDTALVFAVALAPALGGERLGLAATGGEVRPYVRYGTLAFRAGGRTHRLAAFQEATPTASGAAGRLFVPFTDRTSGRETYGGGRYLDLAERADGAYVLDFNAAYHPYCVYDPAWSCPIPPAENRLALAVTAGERLAAERP